MNKSIHIPTQILNRKQVITTLQEDLRKIGLLPRVKLYEASEKMQKDREDFADSKFGDEKGNIYSVAHAYEIGRK